MPAADIRANHASGATLTSRRDGSQHRTQTSGTPTTQIPAPLAIIIATSRPTTLVSTLPTSISQAARRRGRRRSNTANSADFTITAAASTRIEPVSASAGIIACINGTTGSHAILAVPLAYALNSRGVGGAVQMPPRLKPPPSAKARHAGRNDNVPLLLQFERPPICGTSRYGGTECDCPGNPSASCTTNDATGP